MNLNTILTNYVSSGYSGANAMAKTCQDIILRQISKSDLNKNITIKGGVAMMAISKDKRRATQDIDLDFIRYSLEDSAIVEFIKKLNDDEVKIKIVHPIQKLHHHDYDGKRVIIDISDNHGNTFSTKLDIGIHKDTNIEQDELCFDLNVDSETVLLFANFRFFSVYIFFNSSSILEAYPGNMVLAPDKTIFLYNSGLTSIGLS